MLSPVPVIDEFAPLPGATAKVLTLAPPAPTVTV
jgi:hypothetical protein